MLRFMLIALLFLSAVALGQPFQGPFTVVALDSGLWLRSFTALPGAGDTVVLLYSAWAHSGGYEVYRAAFSLDNHALIGSPAAFTSAPDASVQGAMMLPDGRWVCAVVQDYHLNLFRGGATGPVEIETLAIGQVQGPQCWGECWSYSTCHFAPRVGGGFVMAASEDHYYDVGGYAREIDGLPQLYVFDAGSIEPVFTGTYSERVTFNSANAYPISLTADTTAIIVGDGAGVTSSWWIYEDNLITPPDYQDSTCDAYLMNAMRTPGGRILGAILPYDNSPYLGSGIIHLVDSGPCDFLGLFGVHNEWPNVVASAPQFGFAALISSVYAIDLVRLDTTGAMTLPMGTVVQSEGSHLIASDIAMSPEGRIIVSWLDGRELRIASLGWETPLKTNDSQSILQPSSFRLSAYPNPFNSELRVEYSLPKAERVELAVYNLLGQKVATLFEGTRNAGTHAQMWSPAGAGGIYFVSLKSEETARSLKVAYLK